MMKQYFFLILLVPFILIPVISVSAYNSGFQPVYQPPSPPGGIANIHDIGNVTGVGCALGQVLAVNGSAVWACLTLSGSGEINTASNVGLGHGVFKQKTVFDLEFKNIFCAGDLLCSNNGTDIRISYDDPAGGSGNATVLNDLGDVFTAPVFGEVLYYDGNIWEEHILILQQDIGDVSITLAEYGDMLYYDGTYWVDKIFKLNSKTCSAGQFVSDVNNQTGAITCSTPSGSGNMTVLSDGGDVTITSPEPLSVLYYVGSQWIDKIFSVNTQSSSNDIFITGINNQTGAITTKQFSVNTQTSNADRQITGIDNVTGAIQRNTFSVNTQTCSSQFVSAIDNSTGQVTCTTATASGGATSLGSNVTTSLTTSHLLVWTIPLTANSGNQIEFSLTAHSNTLGVSPQIGVNTTVGSSRGWCTWVHPVTATTTEIDLVSANSTNRFVRDTGATAWIATTINEPMPIKGDCSIKSGATPGNLLFWLQAETTGTVGLKDSSNYIKTD